MLDLGMINSEWKKVDEKWTRVFTVESDAMFFAKDVFFPRAILWH